ncbi:MAG: CocE/NonD family hydrolase [Anaerolineae bacterium]
MGYGLRVDFDIPATMRDGTVLRANIFRPDAPGDFPVALTRTPYGKDFATSNPILDAVRLARAGYIVIIQDCRGRFASEGTWFPFRHEGEDGYDTVEWAAALPGSNGRVGMFGASYSGFTQWATAMQNPPHLYALVPAITWADALDGITWRGGAAELGTSIYWYLSILGLELLLRRQRGAPPMEQIKAVRALVQEIDNLRTQGYWSLPLNQFAPLRNHDLHEAFVELIAGWDMPDAYAHVSPASAHDRIRTPAFNIGGWYDIFTQGTLDNYTALSAAGPTPESRQARLLMGPWSHLQNTNVVGEMDFGFASNLNWINVQFGLTDLTARWFDYWLKGIENGVTQEPPVKLFIMGDNVWRDEKEWPLARTRYTNWYLQGARGLALDKPDDGDDSPPDQYTYDPANPTPTNGGALLMNPLYHAGVYDQRETEARPDGLSYTSAPLERDAEVTGQIVCKLWAASDAPDTDFVARLVDVHPDGFAQNLVDGIIRARYRNGNTPELLEPGRPYELTIDLWSTANVFKKGHRIRLDICSANFPRWDRNHNTGALFGTDTTFCVAHQTVFHDAEHPSHVVLPMIPT